MAESERQGRKKTDDSSIGVTANVVPDFQWLAWSTNKAYMLTFFPGVVVSKSYDQANTL
jgi:hypothetical protein